MIGVNCGRGLTPLSKDKSKGGEKWVDSWKARISVSVVLHRTRIIYRTSERNIGIRGTK